MRILRVRLHGFGQFNSGLEVTFSPRELNVIIGRNEAGKSTLLNSIFGTLFGFRDLNQVRRYEPWDDHEAYASEIDLSAEDGRKLRFFREFKSNQATIHELVDGAPREIFSGSADPRSNHDEDLTYFELLGQILGFQDEAIFRSTVFFGQQSLHTAVSDQIRRLISGSHSMDYKGALHELHRRYADLTTENPWTSRARPRRRVIEESEANLRAASRQLTEGRRNLSRSLELEEELESIRASLAEVDQAVEQDRVALSAHEKLHALLARQENADRRYEEALARRDNFHRYSDRDREIEERLSREYSQFRHTPKDLPDLVRSYAADQRETAELEEVLRHEKRVLDRLVPRPNLTLATTMSGAALLLGLILGALTPAGLAVGGAVGGALAIVAFMFGRNVGTGFKQQRAALQKKVSDVAQNLRTRRKRSQDVLAQVGPALVGRDPDAALLEYKAFQELREEKKRLQAAMKALGSRELVDREFAESSRERGAISASLEDIEAKHPSLVGTRDRSGLGKTIESLRTRSGELLARTATKRQRLEECRIELAGLGARSDFDLAELEEGVREERHRLERFDLERDALKESIDTLDACLKEFQEGDVFRLSDEISSIFARITDDKYNRVHLGASLDPVISRGDRVPISPADLSQGAQDQLYFAMRVAMARHLSKNIRLPLFLDDPFVNFDEERLAITKQVLDNLVEHQVVMVTCDRDYESWGGHRIDLDKIERN